MRESWWSYATRKPVALALACAVIAAAVVPPANAASNDNQLVGSAHVFDGDTLDVSGKRVRLEGIDAPEAGQRCVRGLIGTWACGAAATEALRALVDGKTVTCERHGTDKYGRMLGVCFADGVEINRRMVEDGNAWAFVRYSKSYVAEEQAARQARRGVFTTANQPPWEYRTHRWADAEQQAPNGCAIKGNVTRNGHIYHMPWSPWYAKVVIDETRGERWFCSEREAQAAGWRPVHGP
jgi:endonuclease YncB( thermonuclease family)